MKQKHRITALLTAICMLLTLVPFNAVTVTAVDGNFGGGSGTSDDPYLIEDAADLRAFRDLVNGGDTDACGKLVNDINLNPGFTFKADGSYDGEGTPEQWTPIGSENLPYIGTFSGDNKTISGVYINVNAAYQGLFGYIDGGAVQDLTTQDGYIQGNGDVGGISGYAANAAIKNCVNGCYLASTSSHLGGIGGRIETTLVSECVNKGSLVSGTYQNGGITGNASNSIIDDCINEADITVADHAAGITAYNDYGVVSNSINYGNVSTTNSYFTYTAGIVANNRFSSSQVISCLNFGTISGSIANNSKVAAIVTQTDNSGTSGENCYSVVDACSALGQAAEDCAFLSASEMSDTAALMSKKQPIYSIYTKIQLEWFRDKVNAGDTDTCGRLENDIVLNDNFDQTLFTLNEDDTLSYDGGEIPASFEQWEPIADESGNAYVGTFDGNGKTISGLYFNDNSSENGQRVGLFGFLGEGGKIQNLTLSNSIVRGQIYVGGIVGESSGTFENCINEADVIATNVHAGGIVASASSNDATIINCHNTGNIKGMAYVGGIAGRSLANITNCTNTGDVEGSGTYGVGGIIGITTDQYSVTVKGCYNTGNITSTSNVAYVGGIVGSFPNDDARGTIEDCYNTGAISAVPTSGMCAGGLLGGGYGNIYDSFNTGTVTGNLHVGSVGGFVNGNVENCYYLSGSASVGVETASDDAKDEGSFTEMSADDMTGPSALTNMKFDNTVWTAGGETTWEFDEVLEDDETLGTYIGTAYLPQLAVFSDNDHQTLSMTKTDLIQQVDDEDGKTYYLIYTAEQLETFRDKVNGGETDANGKLMADIDLNPGYTFNEDGTYIYSGEGEDLGVQSWTPIGDSDNKYTGNFNGNSMTVSGLYINNSSSYQGLFGYVGSRGVVKNTGIVNSYIKGENYVGGIAGQNFGGEITGCYNSAAITGNEWVGGIVGYQMTGQITGCYNIGKVYGATSYSGGVAGYNYMGTIENCYNTGSVTAVTGYVGGITGYNGGYGTVRNSYNTGMIHGSHSNSTGAIAGYNANIITNCYYLDTSAESGVGALSGGNTTSLTLAEIEDADNLLANLVEGSGESVWNTTLSAVGEWEYGKPAVQPVLSYQTVVANAPKYSVTIPESATVGGEAATVSMTGSALLSTQEVVVMVDENTDFNLYYGGNTSDDSVAYALYVDGGTTAVTAGDTVLTGGNTAEEQSNSADLNFTATETPKYSGSYSGSITFNVSMQTVS